MKGELVVLRKPTGRRIELQVDGQAVSWVELPYRELRIGRAVLSFGGLAGVFTEREHRHRGYSRRVLERAVEQMTADGLDLSMLFGIPDFYHKFGYRTTLSDYLTEVPGRRVVGLPVGFRVRRVPRSRHAEILPLYDRELRVRGFGTVRRKATWGGYTRGVGFRNETIVAGFYRGRRLAGYVAFDDEPAAVNVSEASADSAEMARGMLAWLGRLCRRRVVETVRLHLPPRHALSLATIERGGTFTRRTHVGGGGMMRVLHLGRTMAALMPELASRWAASRLAGDGLDLTLATDLGPAEVVLPARSALARTHRGRVQMSQDRLTQLVTGYMSVADLAARSDVRVPRSLLAALDVLFPERSSTILSTNCF